MKNEINLLPGILLGSILAWCSTVPLTPLLLLGLAGPKPRAAVHFSELDILGLGTVFAFPAACFALFGLIFLTLLCKEQILTALRRKTFGRIVNTLSFVCGGGLLSILALGMEEALWVNVVISASICVFLGIQTFAAGLKAGLKAPMDRESRDSSMGYTYEEGRTSSLYHPQFDLS